MKPRIAYILDRFPHGQTSIVNELRTLEGNEVDVHIVSLRHSRESDAVRVAYMTDYPVTYLFNNESKMGWGRFIKDNTSCMVNHPVNYILTAVRSLRWGGSNFKLTASFARALEVIKPHLVYVNWSWATCGSVMYACRILKLPFIFSVQGTDIMPPACNFSLRVKTAEKILTPSPGYVEILKNKLGVPAAKIRLVP
ncbi:MAG: glycosyltransferase, partial [Planctomycetota bacterium]